jgi:hypothetical protein
MPFRRGDGNALRCNRCRRMVRRARMDGGRDPGCRTEDYNEQRGPRTGTPPSTANDWRQNTYRHTRFLAHAGDGSTQCGRESRRATRRAGYKAGELVARPKARITNPRPFWPLLGLPEGHDAVRSR